MGGSASHELVLYPPERAAVSAGGRHGKLQAYVGAWAMRCSQAKLLPATTHIDKSPFCICRFMQISCRSHKHIIYTAATRHLGNALLARVQAGGGRLVARVPCRPRLRVQDARRQQQRPQALHAAFCPASTGSP